MSGYSRLARVYGAYLFTEKDPVIDELRTMIIAQYGKLTKKVLRQVERDGGATAGAMINWFYGDTRRPASPSAEATGRACGKRRVWVNMTPDARKAVERNATRLLKQRKDLRKARAKARARKKTRR